MKGFIVYDSACNLWFWWNGEKYSHWYDAKLEQWVCY